MRLRLLTLMVAAALMPAAARAQDYTIAFTHFGPLNSDIFIADRDGAGAVPFLPHPSLDYNPSFSPDGRWILFTSERGGSADIYRAHPDGSGLERLTDAPAFDDQAELSPDGTTLAFVSSRSGNADIWLLDLRTRQMRNVTSHAAARPLRFTKFHARFGFAFGPGSIRRARARLDVPITAEGQIGRMKEDRPGPAIAADHQGARIVAK